MPASPTSPTAGPRASKKAKPATDTPQAGAWRSRIVGTGTEDPTQLVANPRNWRIHPKGQQDALSSVLDEVGWVQQVMVNRTTGNVVDGHLRVELALSREEAEVPVLYVELTEEEEALVLASLDPLSAMAATDADKLRELLAEVTVDQADLAAQLASMAPKPKGGKTDPDDAPDAPDEPYVKPGDLWLLGEHRLLCGDATKAEDVARLLDGAKVNLVATDPPYGVDYAEIVEGRSNQKRGGWDDIKNDGATEEADKVVGGAIDRVRDHAAEGCAVLVWHPTGENAAAFRAALLDAQVKVHKQIIWVKPTLVFGRHEYHWRHETAMYGWFDGNRAAFYGDRSETTVWEVDPGEGFKVRNGPAMATGGLGEHPTQKPVELSARPIRNHTHPGQAVYDPFVGSGTAIIAAEQTGRRCYAMDIDPKYAQVAKERWEAFTGLSATRG